MFSVEPGAQARSRPKIRARIAARGVWQACQAGAGSITTGTRAAIVRMPLRLRITALVFALVLVVVGGLGAVISISEEQTLMSTQAVYLRSEARLALQGLRREGIVAPPDGVALSPVHADPPASLYIPLRTITDRLTNAETHVVVWSPEGQMLVTSEQVEAISGITAPSLVTPSETIIRQTLTAAPHSSDYLVLRDQHKQRQLVILLPVVDQHTGAVVAVVQVSAPLQPITAAVTGTRAVVMVSVIVALALAALLAFPLVSAGLRPLVVMERTSRRIAEGDLSARLDEPPTNDEVGRLARSFNSMVQQLERTFTRQRQFVADVSHELRTPLTALNGELEMLLLGADRGDVEGVRRLSRGMHAEIGRLHRLVEDLLVLAQFDEGKAPLVAQPVRVGRLLDQTARLSAALGNGQRIETVNPDPDLEIFADPDGAQQALLDVVDNAMKHTPPDGRVQLEVRRVDDGQMVAIQVSDTGRGIPAEALPHVFDRFYRADTGRARRVGRAGGAGLGLAIVKSLVEAQGGTVAISSVYGGGTTVTLSFPVAPTQDPSKV